MEHSRGIVRLVCKYPMLSEQKTAWSSKQLCFIFYLAVGLTQTLAGSSHF